MHLAVDISLRQGGFTLNASIDCWSSALGVFGPSGSGKSTLIRVIAGLAKPDSGYLELDGDVLFDSENRIWVPPHLRGIGVVFQDARLFPHWSTEKNLRAGMTLETTGMFSFEHIVKLLELQPLLKRSVNDLSGGEKQRVALGRALLAHPRLLLMDEPVSGLDAKLKEQILPFLARVHRELHLPCILVSHDLPDILRLTDRLVLVRDGMVCGQNTLEGLVTQRGAFDMMRRSGLMSFVSLEVDGEPVRAGVRPDEIMLANRPVEGLSARYRKPGVIVRLIDHGPTILCLIDTDEERLMADITPDAVRELGLKEGSPVWCFFKAGAVHSFD
ncbi:MAG: ATP-binding cassette domain-containing protein [Kiritimatiellales bacterium]|nr:ATP-binding cassette domain-containing protein [Kiritimatiellales bacterium]